MTDYRILIVGDGGVGKTSYIDKCVSDEFNAKYQCTFGVVFRKKYIEADGEMCDVTFIDCAGQEKYSFPTAVHKNTRVDGAIIMFDVASFLSFGSVLEWRNRINNVYGNIPIVLCGNKVDSPRRYVTQSSINFHRKAGIKYYDISVKSGYNCTFPLIDMIGQIYNARMSVATDITAAKNTPLPSADNSTEIKVINNVDDKQDNKRPDAGNVDDKQENIDIADVKNVDDKQENIDIADVGNVDDKQENIDIGDVKQNDQSGSYISYCTIS